MGHIASPPLPGIIGLLAFRPESAGPMMGLAQQLLRGPSPLSAAERELIAAVVSAENNCDFCHRSHAAAAARVRDVRRRATAPSTSRCQELE